MNNQYNLDALKTVALALGELNDKVVFVGGAVLSFYINDPGAQEARVTLDIDLTFEILNAADLENLRQQLNLKGFTEDFEDSIICRFKYQKIKVDIMATHEIGWAPANTWFEEGFKNSETIYLGQVLIRILSLPYYLAIKFVAFKNRGGMDPRFSKDLEDITYILDNRSDFVDEILKSPASVLSFLKISFTEILNNQKIIEAVKGNLAFGYSSRYVDIENKLKKIIQYNVS